MSINSQPYIESLKVKHSDLEKSIAKESASASFDSSKLSQLKKQKLQIKEELEKLGKK